MKRILFLISITLLVVACKSQNSVTTNEIIKSKGNLYGLKSNNGSLLIDTIYNKINLLNDNLKLTLPSNDKIQNPTTFAYYIVNDIEGKNAIFDKDGKLIFPFMDCSSLQIDNKTQSVVATKKDIDNRTRKYLYNLEGELQLEANYKDIAFIRNTDLLALISNDGQNKEYYIYNSSNKKKLGPFDHFSIYNETMSSFAMQDSDFERLKKLNLITIRNEIDNEYQWGIIDLNGDEILPMEYRSLKKVLEQDRNHPAFKKAVKPVGVDFVFTGKHISDLSKPIYFDTNFIKYQFIISVKEGVYEFKKL
jgi:hypothetical protein